MILIRTTITEEKPFDVTVRAWPKMKTAAHQKVGDYWWKHFLPRHFRYDAKHKYKHAKRNTSYLLSKQKKARFGRALSPGTVDNVLTGAAKQALMSSSTIRAFPTRATLKMVAPSYFLMKPFTGNRSAGFTYGKNGSKTINAGAGQQPPKGEETTRVTPAERAKLGEVLRDEMERQIKQFRAKRVTTI